MAESLSPSLPLSSSPVYLSRMILVAIALLCLGSTAFAALITSTSDNPRALVPRGHLQKRAPVCDDKTRPQPSAGNCTLAIQTMPMTRAPAVGVFGGTFSNVMTESSFRLPRWFPHQDCMVYVDMKSTDIFTDQSSWNEIAQKALDVFRTCVEGPAHQHGGRELAGYRSGIEIELSWNFPEMDTLALVNRPDLVEPLPPLRMPGQALQMPPPPPVQMPPTRPGQMPPPPPRVVGRPAPPPPSGWRG